MPGAVLAGFMLGYSWKAFASMNEVKALDPTGIDQIIIYLVAYYHLLTRPRGLMGRKWRDGGINHVRISNKSAHLLFVRSITLLRAVHPEPVPH